MKLLLQNQPIDLPALDQVLQAMPDYPATAAEVRIMAKHLHAPANIIEYLGTLPPDLMFGSRDEAFWQASEVIELSEELATEPPEYLRSYDG